MSSRTCSTFVWGYPTVLEFESMTAIVCQYTRGGFILAADGFRRSFAPDYVELDLQKVFPLTGASHALAYACSGVTVCQSAIGQFDFVKEIEVAASSLPPGLYFDEYVIKTVQSVHGAFERRAMQYWGKSEIRDVLSQTDDGAIFVATIFAGYFNGKPMCASAEIRREGLTLRACLSNLQEAPAGFRVHSGSTEALAIYKAAHGCPPDTLQEAAVWAREYISLCASRRGSDPACEEIGGHIHIASITPAGFKWMIPPLES